MTTVILAEKPSQARAYAEAFAQSKKGEGLIYVADPILPRDTVITYGFGHLVELAMPEAYDPKYKRWAMKYLPIFPDSYKYFVPRDKQKQFKIVSSLLKKADTIVVATDSDREGENIAWSIMRQSGIDPRKKRLYRLWINSLEKSAIREGFQNLRNGWDFFTRYKEAQTRQISDWLVGMNGSPLFTLQLRKQGIKGVYSIGRVQTPTLYMVYQRDEEIDHFKPVPYTELTADFWASRHKFSGKLEPYQRFETPASLYQFLEQKGMGLGKQEGVVEKLKKEVKQVASPSLFSLSSLQSEANRRFRASASQTLKAVQNLYENKFLSYPRTDCNYITDKEYAYLAQNLDKYLAMLDNGEAKDQLKPVGPDKRYVNSAKVQEHHAIIPTRTTPAPARLAKMSRLDQQVYDLVVRRTLGMFLKPYEYEKTTALIRVDKLLFKATGNVTVNRGWKVLETRKEKAGGLPQLAEGQVLSARLSEEQKETKPPAKFTEGTLITAMKTAGKTLDDEEAQAILKDVEGIGTEATRASTIDILKKRGYLEAKKNQLTVTPSGQILAKAAEAEPLLVSAQMTAQWEKALKQIGQGQRSQDNFLEQIKRFISQMIQQVPDKLTIDPQLANRAKAEKQAAEGIAVCPVCKAGQIMDKGKFYGCSNYKSGCRFTLPKKFAGKSLGKRIVRILASKGKTDKLDGFVSKKTGQRYSAKLQLEGDKLVLAFD